MIIRCIPVLKDANHTLLLFALLAIFLLLISKEKSVQKTGVVFMFP